jgi:hypothetical protein
VCDDEEEKTRHKKQQQQIIHTHQQHRLRANIYANVDRMKVTTGERTERGRKKERSRETRAEIYCAKIASQKWQGDEICIGSACEGAICHASVNGFFLVRSLMVTTDGFDNMEK